jgi:hypothetical protein
MKQAVQNKYKQNIKGGSDIRTAAVTRFWVTEKNMERPTTSRGIRDRQLIINLQIL